MKKGCKAENSDLAGRHVDIAGMDAKNITCSRAKTLDLASLSIESKGMTKRQEVNCFQIISDSENFPLFVLTTLIQDTMPPRGLAILIGAGPTSVLIPVSQCI